MKNKDIDNQEDSKVLIKQDLILEIKPTQIPCKHLQQRVEKIGRKHYQICCSKKCERKLFVR